MYTTNYLIERGIIPTHLKEYILINCPHCGSPILRSDNLTQTKCSSSSCIGHMKYKAYKVLQYFNYKGVGPESCETIIRVNNLNHHLQVMVVCLNFKPKVKWWEVVYLLQIEGYSSTAEKELGKYNSIVDYLQNCPTPNEKLVEFAEVIHSAEDYFEIIEAGKGLTLETMITGSLDGFTNKKDFVTYINERFKNIINLVMVGVKQSSHLCISQNKSSNSRKAKTARNYGIPILTPTELISLLSKYEE